MKLARKQGEQASALLAALCPTLAVAGGLPVPSGAACFCFSLGAAAGQI